MRRGSGLWAGALLLLAAPAAAQPIAARPDAAAPANVPGRILERDVAAAAFGRIHVTIWLPPGYDRGQGRYPVLYMTDGQTLFDSRAAPGNPVWAADAAMLAVARRGAIRPHIIVGIWHLGDSRFRDYLPAAPLATLPAEPAAELAKRAGGGLRSDAYLDFIVRELKPRVDAELRTRPKRDDTAIAGAGLGGLIAFYALAEHPKTFGRAAGLSPDWPVLMASEAGPLQAAEAITAAWALYIARRLGKPDGRRLWFDRGTAGNDGFLAPYQAAVDAALVTAGWQRGRDFASRDYPGAGHDAAAWAARLPEVLAWMLADPKAGAAP